LGTAIATGTSHKSRRGGIMEKRLYRSKDQRMIWGICGGLAQYIGIDPTIVRVLWVLSLLIGGFGILAYIILYFVIPLES
jgi:phage shock protein C